MRIVLAEESGRVARGFVTVMVVLMFVFIAGAVVSLTLLFATEVKRTRATVSGAQLRLLLLAAGPQAGEELRLRGAGLRDVRVATPVKTGELALHIVPLGGDGAEVRAVAKSGGAAWGESLVYRRAGGEWRLESAVLSGGN